MKYFKNIEVARLFGINPTTVTNYINSAKNGKNLLQLVQIEDRSFIIDNAHNRLIIEKLAGEGNKFKSKDLLRTISPKKEFYEVFSNIQISEIITSLEVYHEIPHKFTYFKQGARIWQQYAEKSFEEDVANTVTNTDQMLNLSFEYFVNQLDEGEQFDIYDIGVGDASPVRDFLQKLIQKQLVRKYIGIDVSQEMLDIAGNNLKKWFGKSLNFETSQKDVSKDNLREILFFNKNKNDSKKIRNLILFVGSTIENQQDNIATLLNIKNSLGLGDIFVLGETLDTQSARIYFSLNLGQGSAEEKSNFKKMQNAIIPDLLNMESEDYEVEMYYDEKKKCRFMNMVLNSDLQIELKNEQMNKTVFLRKGSKINVWHHYHHSISEIISTLNYLKFGVKHFISSKDEAQCLVTCQLTLDK